MGILERTRHVIGADLNDLLKKARNPRAILDAYLDDLEMILEEALSIRNTEETERDMYAARLRDIHDVMQTMEKKATACLKNDDEELARTALERKLDLQEDAAELQKEIDQRSASLAILKDSVHSLEARIAEVNRRLREMRFRHQIIQARSELQQTMNRVGHDRDEPMLSQARDELTEMEGRLEAEESFRKDNLDDRVLRMEVAERKRRRRQVVDDELTSLRRKLAERRQPSDRTRPRKTAKKKRG